MPRRLLRDGRIVADEWRYAAEADVGAPLILNLAEWQSERERWLGQNRRLGVVLSPVHKVEILAADLNRLDLVAAEFAGPGEGRGYSQARQLRGPLQFKGEVRAVGFVRRDQLYLMARAGFNSFEMLDTELETAVAALADFSYAYQPSNDAGLPIKPRHRWPDKSASA
jgi:uncharacterized protein (DUF934 family)